MKTRLDLVLVLCLLSVAARADEGMWMPQQIPQLAERLKAMGFRGDPQAFADLTGQPMGAIVSLGGCSASFVSPEWSIFAANSVRRGRSCPRRLTASPAVSTSQPNQSRRFTSLSAAAAG